MVFVQALWAKVLLLHVNFVRTCEHLSTYRKYWYWDGSYVLMVSLFSEKNSRPSPCLSRVLRYYTLDTMSWTYGVPVMPKGEGQHFYLYEYRKMLLKPLLAEGYLLWPQKLGKKHIGSCLRVKPLHHDYAGCIDSNIEVYLFPQIRSWQHPQVGSVGMSSFILPHSVVNFLTLHILS